MLPVPSSPAAIFLSALVFASIVAGAAYAARALTLSGALAAAAVGTIIFERGGWRWAAALLTFFVTSSALSRWRKRRKAALNFEKTGRRDAAQVWANGGPAVVCAVLPLLDRSVTVSHAYLPYLAALAAATADTWATEIGAATGGEPYLITTRQRAARGTSGAVSAAGLGASVAGASLMAVFAGTLDGFLMIAVSGFFGAMFDSVLGATVQAQWKSEEGGWSERPRGPRPDRGWRYLGNDLVNFLCTGLAAVIAGILARV